MELTQNYRDQLIDEVMQELYRIEHLSIYTYLTKKNLAFQLEPEAERFARSVVESMVREELVTRPAQTSHVKTLSLKGKKIVQDGGWLKYLEKEKSTLLKEEQQKEWQGRLTRWQVQTKYLPYVISFFSLIISGLSLGIAYKVYNRVPAARNEIKFTDSLDRPASGRLTFDSLKTRDTLAVRNDSIAKKR
jgi:hypothetical protein